MKKRISYFLIILLLLQGCVIPIPEILFPTETITAPEEVSTLLSPTSTSSLPTKESPQPTSQEIESETATSLPIEDVIPTQTASLPVTLTPVNTPPATTTPKPVLPAASPTPNTIIFRTQTGGPAYAPNVFHQESGCNWMGVGGQVLGENGAPMQNLVVELGGILSGGKVSMLKLTGTSPMYGEGGYEFTLADRPLNSDQTLWLQVTDLENTPLSEKVYFSTYEDCNLNMIIINFVLEPVSEVFIPLIMK